MLSEDVKLTTLSTKRHLSSARMDFVESPRIVDYLHHHVPVYLTMRTLFVSHRLRHLPKCPTPRMIAQW
jgi:hypothetical protein